MADTATPTIGVDVGGTRVRGGLVGSDGALLATRSADTARDADGVETAIAEVVAGLVADASAAAIGPPSAVGLAVAGFVTADRRAVHFAPHLPWRGVPVAERMGERIGLPVLLEHDANAAAVAEHRVGAARGRALCVLVALGTGIGGALLIDGVPYRGAYGVAPELGHLRVVPDGRSCPCGKRGCWERYCSGTALAATAAAIAADRGLRASPSTGRDVAAAAVAGDPVALAAFADLARWLGEGIGIVEDVFDPELVVIGGGVVESGGLFLDAARTHADTVRTGGAHRPAAEIVPAHLGRRAGIVGAALLAAEYLG